MAIPLLAMLAAPDSSSLLLASTWHEVAHNALRGVRNGLMLFLLIFAIERLYKVSTSKYLTRNFFHDACYWVYGKSDLPRILFTTALFSYVSTHFAYLQIAAFAQLHPAARFALYYLCADFILYWVHRCQHSWRFLWAFHSVHHSQERMSFATSVRVHPVDNFILTTVVFIVLLPLGPPVKMVVPFYFVMELLIDLQHTEIPWRFGPLYRLVVSPAFHSIHHSASPEHHNRHFGRSLSIWDYLFGTAVHGHARPVAFGLEGWKAPTLASQLCSPFARAYRAIVPTHHPERCSRAMSAAPEQVAFPSEAER